MQSVLSLDPRARLKSWVRRYSLLAAVAQWIFDPAFTPRYVIRRWLRAQPGAVLNLGSGSRSLGAHVVNLDIEPSAHVHVVSHADTIPFEDETFAAVLLEYVVEHVADHRRLLDDAVRVLEPGGSILATIPFRQSFHACPNDYWRFTHEGLEQLFRERGLEDVRVEAYGGPASAWIDSTKEFLATIFSFGSPLVYSFLSQVLIVPFIPLRYLDVVLRRLPTARYTAFSFVVTARKPGTHMQAHATDFRAALRPPPGFRTDVRDGVVYVVADGRP